MNAVRHIVDVEEWRNNGAVVPVCVAGFMLVAVHSYALGAMMVPLQNEFGWSRAEISAGPAIPSFTALILAPLVGRAVDRYGARKIAMLGVPLFCAALAALSQTSGNIIAWLTLYAALGVASMLIFPMVWTSVIARRFERNRGLAMAVALTGSGLSSTLVPAITVQFITWFGWRGAYLGLASLGFAIVFPLVLLLFRETPRRPRSHAERLASPDPSRAVLRGVWASPGFILLATAAFLFSLAVSMLIVNALPILLSEGFEKFLAAKIAGLMGLGAITGRLAGGLLLDRWDARYVAAGSVVAPILGALLLLNTTQSIWAAMFASFALGLAGGTEYDACAYLTAERFSLKNFGSIFGAIGALSLFGNGISPIIANHMYDMTGSYDRVLVMIMPILVIAGVCFIALGRRRVT